MSSRVARKRQARKPAVAKLVHVSVSKIWQSPETDQLYRPVDAADPEIVALAKSIHQCGILEPLVITTDGFIVSGHRRYAAVKLAGLETVPCRVRSFTRSMCDELSIFAIHPIKVALTADQVKRHNLPPIMQAKRKSSRYKTFVKQHGRNVFELEAVPPETLQSIVRSAIEGVIDRDAFDAEIAVERDDAGSLAGARRTVQEALQGIDLEVDADE